MCRVPDPEDAKYKDEDAYEDDLEEMQTKTDKIKPKTFPYTFYLMDEKQEKAYDEKIFPTTKVQFTGMTVAETLSLIQINPRRTLSLRTCTSLSIQALNRSKYTQVARRHSKLKKCARQLPRS